MTKKILLISIFILTSISIYSESNNSYIGKWIGNLRPENFPKYFNKQNSQEELNNFEEYIQKQVQSYIPESIDSFYYLDPLNFPINRGSSRGGLQSLEEIERLKELIITDKNLIELLHVGCKSDHKDDFDSLCQVIEYVFIIPRDIPLDEFLLFRIFFHNSSECSYDMSQHLEF